MIEQAARRGDDEVDAATQLVDLRSRADTAEDQRRLLAQVGTEIGDGLLHLRREFTGRNQHERTRRARTTRVRLVFVQLLQQRQRKGGRLAGARLGGGGQVTTFEHRGDTARLDGGGLRVTHFQDARTSSAWRPKFSMTLNDFSVRLPWPLIGDVHLFPAGMGPRPNQRPGTGLAP